MEENLMAYYNQIPGNQMFQQMFGGAPNMKGMPMPPMPPMPPMQQMPAPFSGKIPTKPEPGFKFDENQFFSMTSTLDKNSLQQLVVQARNQGISEDDIKKGLEILLQHR